MQAKRQCKGCGNGGDWALKLEVQQGQPLQNAATTEQQTAGPQSRRVSVLFYIADEAGTALSMLEAGAAAAAESRLFSSGQHGIAGDWQLHVRTPGLPHTAASEAPCMSFCAANRPKICFDSPCISFNGLSLWCTPYLYS